MYPYHWNKFLIINLQSALKINEIVVSRKLSKIIKNAQSAVIFF